MYINNRILEKLNFYIKQLNDSKSSDIIFLTEIFNKVCTDNLLLVIINDIINSKIYGEEEFEEFIKYSSIIIQKYHYELYIYMKDNDLIKKIKDYDMDLYVGFFPLHKMLTNMDVVENDFNIENSQGLLNDVNILIKTYSLLSENENNNIVEKIDTIIKNKLNDYIDDYLNSKKTLLDKRLCENNIRAKDENSISWDMIKSSIKVIEDIHQIIEKRKQYDIRTDLLELMSHIKYYVGFNVGVEKVYEMNPKFEKYAYKKRRSEFALDKRKSDEELKYSLIKILESLKIQIYNDNHISTIFHRYSRKVKEFGKFRIKEIANCMGGLSEKYLQNNLAEYLFDERLNVFYEKAFGDERVDIFVQSEDNEYLIETKYMSDIQQIKEFFKGIRQLYKYLDEHNQKRGYIVIFQNDNDYYLNTINDIYITNKYIEIINIDLTDNLASTDNRKIVKITEKDTTNMIFENIDSIKWTDLSLSNLLLIDNIGPISAINIFNEKNKINSVDDVNKLLEIDGIGRNKIEIIKRSFEF